MELSAGSRVGPYEIVAPIGSGGMGEVYRARDTRLDRDVAVKALPAAFVLDPERLARFEREAKLLASLSHPNIAGIYGVEQTDGGRYLALELVEGETLASRLARGPLPLDEALDVARQIAAGLEAAHEGGVVHRDLKPANVRLTPSGAVKVLDFGLAKAGAAGPGTDPSLSPTMTTAATQAGVILGTAAYMSPEQARGRVVDKRTDIWSFGCVLYECLVGRQLIQGETASDLIAAILRSEPDLAALPASTPAPIRALLGRCLCKDVKERLRDIGEARIALASPGEAAPPGTTRTRGIPWWAAIAMALLLAAITMMATSRLGRSTAPAPLTKLDLSGDDIDVGLASGPVLSPDGRRIAYVSKSRIWIRELDQLQPRAVTDITAPTPVGWSPDSRTVVYADSRKLWTVPVAAGGRPTAVCEIPGTGSILGAAWSQSGTIAFSVWRGAMYRVPAAGARAELWIDIDPATIVDFHSPSWASKDELLYVTHWKNARDDQGRERVHLTVFDGKAQTQVGGDSANVDNSPIATSDNKLLFLRGGGSPGIWAAPFDLRGRRVAGPPILVAPDAESLSAAEDGALLYMEKAAREEAREMVWVDRSGKVTEVVGSSHIGLSQPALSPDGRRIAFAAASGDNMDVWVRDLARGTETRLTFGAEDEVRPAWLASSSRLAYFVKEGLQGRIMSLSADGSSAPREFAPKVPMRSLRAMSIAPDGKSAVRIVEEQGLERLKIGSVLPDGTLGPLRPLLQARPEPEVGDATISTDGRLLAYVTDDPGQVSLFLTRFPAGVGTWEVGAEGGRAPTWSKDGKELFFVAGSGPTSRTVVSVKVDSSQDPPLGAMTRLFELSGDLEARDSARFDVAADGQRFLFTRPAGGSAGRSRRMILVQNWREELEKKSGG